MYFEQFNGAGNILRNMYTKGKTFPLHQYLRSQNEYANIADRR